MAGRETYDLSPTEKEILEFRAKRRQMLRQQHLEETGNPYRYASEKGGYLEDLAMNRYHAMTATRGEFFRQTWKNGTFFFGFSIFPVIAFMYIMKKSKDAQENLYRTGQVAYRDREYKFN